jgi:hypothetical protein
MILKLTQMGTPPSQYWGVWGGNPQIQVLTKQSTLNLELLLFFCASMAINRAQ